MTADHHFFHDNIRIYCNRPFVDMATMNMWLEAAWNDNIKPEDEVWHLGDFGFGGRYQWNLEELFKRLHGVKRLIIGSHDGNAKDLPWQQVMNGYAFVDGVALTHDGEKFVRQNKEWEDRPVFCGHVHEIWKVRRNMLNIGVDVWHFLPVLWDKAVQYQKERFDYWVENEKGRVRA